MNPVESDADSLGLLMDMTWTRFVRFCFPFQGYQSCRVMVQSYPSQIFSRLCKEHILMLMSFWWHVPDLFHIFCTCRASAVCEKICSIPYLMLSLQNFSQGLCRKMSSPLSFSTMDLDSALDIIGVTDFWH